MQKNKMTNNIKIKILIFAVTTLLIVLMFPQGEVLDSEVKVGSIWTKSDLIAKMSFPILKDEKTYESEKERAASKVFPVFIKKKDLDKKCMEEAASFFDSLLSIAAVVKDSTFIPEKFPVKKSTISFLIKRKDEQTLITFKGNRISDLKKVLSDAVSSVCKKGILNLGFSEINRDTISVRENKYEKDIPIKNFFDKDSYKDFLKKYLTDRLNNEEEINSLLDILNNVIKPTLIYSEVYTSQARQLAMEKVPRYLGIVNENERIVGKHDRITKEIKLKIDSYRKAKGEEKNFYDIVLEFFGKTLHVFIILFLFGLYIRFSRQEIFNNDKFILLIALLFLFTALQTYVIQFIESEIPFEFLILVPLASMLFTIIFDSRMGFFSTMIISIIVGGLRGNDYILTITQFVAGSFAVFSVRDIKNRNQIFRSFFQIIIGFTLAILAFGFERFVSFTDLVLQFSFAASNALLSPILTFGFLFIIERIFGISTDLTYLELSDFNNVLLRELNQKAPGTFNHSTTIGTMVEDAANLIEANSTLARVGAYYHDIGKIYYPEAFVENQSNDENIHEKLKPEESARIIIEHVAKGIELAKEHKLPTEIADFIPMHHGTMLVSFFYEKAKKLYGEENVKEEDFRYPGPKPNTKETGLVMLADACESAIRSMTDIEPQKVENLVSNIIEDRLRDGQLDNTNLNFKHIKIIKDTFIRVLLNLHHKRIRYPNQEEMENSKTSENK